MSGRAVEAAGDVDMLLLDKTGTITLGNRMATELLPLPGVRVEELADAAQLAQPGRRDARGALDRRARRRRSYRLRRRDAPGRGAHLHPLHARRPA